MKTTSGILDYISDTFPLLTFIGDTVSRFIFVISTFLSAKHKKLQTTCMLYPTAWWHPFICSSLTATYELLVISLNTPSQQN